MDQYQSSSGRCSICATTLRPDDRFCPSCGAPNPAYTAPQAPAPPPQPESYAPAPQAAPAWTPPAPPPPPKPSNRRTWYILGGIAVFFILACCCCAFLIAIASAQDSALQEQLEGTAQVLCAVA